MNSENLNKLQEALQKFSANMKSGKVVLPKDAPLAKDYKIDLTPTRIIYAGKQYAVTYDTDSNTIMTVDTGVAKKSVLNKIKDMFA